jgi:predicted transcriptional regulator
VRLYDDGLDAVWLAHRDRLHQLGPMADSSDDAKHLIDQLPAGASWDDVAYEMYVRAEIEHGLADAEAGRLVDPQTAMARARARIRRPA